MTAQQEKLSSAEMEALMRDLFDKLSDFDDEGNRDMNALRMHFAENMNYCLPFFDKPITKSGREAFFEFLSSTNGVFKSSEYTFDRVSTDEKEQRIILEARSIRPLLGTDHEARMSYVFIFGFHGRLISEMREYVYSPDSAIIARAMKLDQPSDA